MSRLYTNRVLYTLAIAKAVKCNFLSPQTLIILAQHLYILWKIFRFDVNIDELT
jgi:hypothetical protein